MAAAVFFSNGVEPTEWWAKGSGADMQLGPAALPMMPHREDMVFINGLFNQSAFVSTSPHLGRMNVLSGAPVSLDPNEIRVGTTMDQIIASQIGGRTAIPSLVLGIERIRSALGAHRADQAFRFSRRAQRRAEIHQRLIEVEDVAVGQHRA